MTTQPVQLGEGLAEALRGLVAQSLHAAGHRMRVEEFKLLGKQGLLPSELTAMYEAVGDRI